MSDAPSAWQLVGAGGGLATVCGGLWGGFKWLFGRAERRQAALDQKEAELVAKLQDTVKEQGARIEALEHDNRKIWLALSYVVPALHALDPRSPALKVVGQILGDAFPIPSDMSDSLNKLD